MIDPDLVAHIHEIALGRATWDEALERLRTEFSTEGSLLVLYGSRPEQARSLSMAGSDGRPWRSYAERFATIDPFIAAMRAGRVPEATIVTGDQVVPPKQFCASEYYNEWFRPNDLRHTAGAFIRHSHDLYLQLGMPRSPRAGPYSAEEIARLQRYFNHIHRALAIGEALRARVGEPDLDRIARAYGLTRAETRLVGSLIETGSLRRSAATGPSSYNTLRAQLRSVFEKTGTHGQAQLIRLVHQMDPSIPPRPRLEVKTARGGR